MKEGMQNSKHRGKEKKITRKQAIKKVGYAAFSAATMLLLLNDPSKAQGDSQSRPEAPPDFDDWDGF